jgi:chromosomal replication initiator protein
MSLIKVWESAQGIIKSQVGESSYETWLANLNPKEKSPDTLLLETPDEFFKNWIIDHYLPVIKKAVTEEAKIDIAIEFDVSAGLSPALPKPRTVTVSGVPQTMARPAGTEINSRFSFNTFVVGPSNRFAYAASLAVAESPAKAYNPLFIYGPVGLGKTHLMQAITGYVQKHHPHLKFSYLSSEQFTNELINAIRHKSTIQFRQKYRHIDVLLIDDIHFIAGKESTQEEFFHTFNTLHDNRKQIIICSDRPPKEIANLEERLVSRFAWGLITDIQPPDFETRVAILKKKLELESAKVPDDVVFFIADQIKTNIRELEGALIRVVAYSLLEEKPLSLAMAKNVLKDMVKETVKIISIEMIQKTVSEFFNLNIMDLKTSRRSQHVVMPRQVAMYLTRKLTRHSLPEIGNAFGGKDHTTVMHSCKKIEQEMTTNAELRKIIDQLTTSLMV